nr:alpha/beta hydrolase [Paenibacillus bovis]
MSLISPEEMFELIRHAHLPELLTYETRDNSKLYYRHYAADSNIILILLHGISEDSKYLFQLAKHISSHHIAQVYTPDLRGYGANEPKGDVDYIGQLDDDIADFIRFIKATNDHSTIILGGHSFGGASVLRFSERDTANQVDAYLFLAPYIHPSAPTNNYPIVSMSKFIMLNAFDKVGLSKFHHWPVSTVNKPSELQHGGEALQISFRLVMSRIPQNYQKNILAIQKPTLVLISDRDELFAAEKFADLYKDNPNILCKILPQHNHDGILFSPLTNKELENWCKQLSLYRR